MLIIFNLIYCRYLGQGAGEVEGGRRVPSLCPSHSFSTAICLCLPPPAPIPLSSGCGSIFYRSLLPSSLSLTPLLPSPHHPLSLALSWASVQLNLYTLCTHNQPNENPTANTLSAGWSASVLRHVGGPGGGVGRRSGSGTWLFWSPGMRLGWGHCIHDVLLCNKPAHAKT